MTFDEYEEDRNCLGRGITGFYGCIWCREDEKKSTSWGQVFWFCAMLYVWFESMIFLHWTVAMNNDDVDIDRALNDLTGIRGLFCWYGLMCIFALVIFVYMTIVTLIGSLHLYVREPLYMSAWHRVLITLCVLIIYSFGVLVLHVRWRQLHLLLLSLDITGPYLQVFMVMLMAVLTWPIAWYWLRWQIGATRVYLLLLYISAMILLYIWPIVIHTPMTISKYNSPPKPKLIPDSGVPSLAPESTLLSIKLARDYEPLAVQLHIWVSYDGTPFVFRDAKLTRTTNVASKFPSDADKHTAYWTIKQLQQLDAGSWFLQSDPYEATPEMTSVRRAEVSQQTVATLAQALAEVEAVVVAVRKEEVKADHPYYDKYEERIVNVLKASNVSSDKIYWLGESRGGAEAFQRLSTDPTEWSDIDQLSKTSAGVSAAYWEISKYNIQSLGKAGMFTAIYWVNSDWLLSLYWALGVNAVITEYPQRLVQVQYIYYNLHPGSYLLTWIVVDVMSILLILVFWFVNYLIYVNEVARRETILMDPVTEKVGYTNEVDEEPDEFYSTPPTPVPSAGLTKKKLPYETSDEGFE